LSKKLGDLKTGVFGGLLMAVYAVIPLKNLQFSKQRLSSIFTLQERKLLTLAMLKDVLKAVKASIIDEVVIVADDFSFKQVADKFNTSYMIPRNVGLNAAIGEASTWSLERGANAVLILPADIPLITAGDISKIAALGYGNPSIVLSPSKDCGTNALCENPPNLIPACFGPASFLRHIREAYSKKVNTKIYSSGGIAVDMDSVEDLKILFQVENSTFCKQVLEQIIQDNKKAETYYC
jgi:2-phospho-L-lactate/phosphoenolpyruvate guanylyltransferase